MNSMSLLFLLPFTEPFVGADSNSCISVNIQDWTYFPMNFFLTITDTVPTEILSSPESPRTKFHLTIAPFNV